MLIKDLQAVESHTELQAVPKSPNEKVDAASNLLRDALGDWWKDDRRKWCAYCGIPMRLRCAKGTPIPPQKATRDHVIPRKHNGGHIAIPACLSCNQAKGTMSVPEFLFSDYFIQKRKHKHRHQWPVEHLWVVTALAAVKRSRSGALPEQCRQSNGKQSPNSQAKPALR